MEKAVMFDLDGTLWDCTEQIVAPWNEILERYGLEKRVTHADLCSVMGKTIHEISKIFFPELPPEKAQEVVDAVSVHEVFALEKSGGTLYPQLRETLTALREKYHVYIISNCEEGYVQAFLNAHKLWDLVEDFEYIGRSGKCKGDNIRLVMERNNIEKGIYVGDTIGDYEATKIAGVPFVHAAYGFGKVENVPKINSFAEIVAVADELLA